MTSELDTIRSVRELLESQSTMTLATVGRARQPGRRAAVLFALRNDLTLYWLSSADSRHSINLRNRPQAAVAVYASVNRWGRSAWCNWRPGNRSVGPAGSPPRNHRRLSRRFRLGALLSVPITQDTLYAFRPSWNTYTDNSRGLGIIASK